MVDIVISEFMDPAAVDDLARDFQVLYEPDLVDRPEVLHASVNNARALIVRNRTQVRGELLANASNLQVVGRLGVGLDNIDLAACRERGITVRPASGANDIAVAEYVMGTAMLLLRAAYSASADVIAGDWPRQRCMGHEIGGKVLGLIGFGGIARETARRARCLGMLVIAHDPFLDSSDSAWRGVEPVGMEQLLARADVISLHVPLTSATRGLVDASAIGLMKRGALLINTSRGGIVDEIALVDALRAGHLGGAALDVFESEPVTAQSATRFADVSNLLLTPHIAGVTQESNIRVSAVTAANVRLELVNR